MGFINLAQASDQSSRTVIDLSRLMEMDQLLDKISDRQVIFVSETHDRYEHHLNQLAIIEHQYQRHSNLVIGLEFFQQPFQSVLDDYIAGRIDEKSMLKKSEYFDRWRFDYRLYQPILAYALEHNIPLLALNIEAEITDQVSLSGIEGLNEQQQSRIPAEINRDDEAYRSRLREIFELHPHAAEKDFEHFFEVQLLWDEGMAAKAADWLQQHPDAHMVILAGSGHIKYGSGIPDRLTRRVAVKTATVINGDPGMTINAEVGDYVIMTEPRELQPSGTIGVMLDTTVSPPRVSGFGKPSVAKQAGIRKGDQIIRIDDMMTEDYADIRLALMDKSAGDKVTVQVIRDVLFFGSEKQSIKIELQ